MVLIADDDTLLAALLCHQLGLRGVPARHSHDGRDVLRQVLEQRPAVVVLDLMLAGTDGFDVLRAIKQMVPTRDIQVLILSPRTMERDVTTALALGAVDYVAKPFDLAPLVDRLVALVQAPAPAEIGHD